MPTPEPQRFVPGTVKVAVERPYARFGLALYVYKESEGNIWVAKVQEDGELIFHATEQGTTSTPTLYIDDELAAALRKALNSQPLRLHDDDLQAHLRDAVGTRDRLLTLVEMGITTMMTARIRYPESQEATSPNVHIHNESPE